MTSSCAEDRPAKGDGTANNLPPRTTIIGLHSVKCLEHDDFTADIFISKKVIDPNDKKVHWTKPHLVKGLKIGEKIDAGSVHINLRNSDKKIKADLSTEWIISDIAIDGRKTAYYEIKKSFIDGQVKLILKEKAHDNYHFIRVTNGVEVMELPKLWKKYFPPRNPQFTSFTKYISEYELFFHSDPELYIYPTMQRTPPKEIKYDPHNPDVKQLKITTNIPYYKFRDGRIVYWDHISKKLMVKQAQPTTPTVNKENFFTDMPKSFTSDYLNYKENKVSAYDPKKAFWESSHPYAFFIECISAVQTVDLKSYQADKDEAIFGMSKGDYYYYSVEREEQITDPLGTFIVIPGLWRYKIKKELIKE